VMSNRHKLITNKKVLLCWLAAAQLEGVWS